MRAVDVIGRKRDHDELSVEELGFVVGGYLGGQVSEGQMAALLMAGVLNGFSDAEALALTDILVGSGATLDLSALPGPTVDKHSTGGVGDGTTLLVAPLLAAAGAQVVKLSGRGLGHTGGTLDKLESIPGFRTVLEPAQLTGIARDVGCVVAAQTDELVPADRALYALRDETGTVASRALIASSVMSKKLAAGAGTIVLDVKAGNGAFLETEEQARELARLCVRIAEAAGRRSVALVTAMETPLGQGIGNALEVSEAVGLLRAAPRAGRRSRLAEVALELAARGLALARGGGAWVEETRGELAGLWSSGDALERLRAMISAQGGDPAVCDDPGKVLPTAPVVREVPADATGWVSALPARAVGEIAAVLGAGRASKGDPVDPAVGLELAVDVGDRVERGQPLAVVHARSDAAAQQAADRLTTLVAIAETAIAPAPTLLDVIHD
ncbi:MAG: thymidine phosphorylase [Nitriliruptorales bacterium]|nr:thymidine phosphorylase [Nitriliruptorales bacterium]